MTMNEKDKQARLKQLREERKRLSLEEIALIDAHEYADAEAIDSRRREIAKRIDELEACISTTK